MFTYIYVCACIVCVVGLYTLFHRLPLCTCTLRFSSTCTFLFPSQQEMVTSGKIQEFAEPVEVVEEREIP